ncbi:polypeptide N-acetylgalactosaminyltransferase 5-like [Mytilus trossulus]|uniref:polypeptide N-acetylgalactosaminyltransferase 5-like n=1 Tax=Mytilus trossulus TaxID=6551 RepID=UPI003004AD8A
MSAKQHGIDQSHTDIIVVMDSHHEVADVWLEPLIDHLKKNPRTLVVPDVGIIDRERFNIHISDFNKTNFKVFAFDFNLDQKVIPLRREYLESREKFWASPIRIPSIIGNIFAANKTFFQKLGGFDTGMEIWGAEQMELSIKYILCGDGIYALPCSKVVHLFRVIPWHLNDKNVSNEYRVAEVWLDEYKHIFLEQKGDSKLKTGDVAARKRIRDVNNCRPFKYYNKIANALIDGYYIPGDNRVRGMIRLMNAPDVCLDNGGKGGLYRCHSNGGNQVQLNYTTKLRIVIHTENDMFAYLKYWELTKDYELRHNYVCVVKGAKFKDCNPRKRVQWDYLKCLIKTGHTHETITMAIRLSLRGDASKVPMRLGLEAAIDDIIDKMDSIYEAVD